MHYLVEEPFYPLLFLGLAAMACLIALQATQQGKFLIWAGGLVGVAALWFVVERLVVTDAERVEAVVYELADAVSRSDIDAVAARLTPDVNFGSAGKIGELAMIRLKIALLRQLHFDYLKVRQLETRAGAQTRMGSAEFRVTASGTYGPDMAFPVVNTAWSLGFREVSPGVWKVNRITAVSVPRQAAPYIGGL